MWPPTLHVPNNVLHSCRMWLTVFLMMSGTILLCRFLICLRGEGTLTAIIRCLTCIPDSFLKHTGGRGRGSRFSRTLHMCLTKANGLFGGKRHNKSNMHFISLVLKGSLTQKISIPTSFARVVQNLFQFLLWNTKNIYMYFNEYTL